MANLRVRLRFNPGRDGSPMDKLGEFATQMERFLRSLASDHGVSGGKGKWVARNFTNESVAFDSEYSDSVDSAAALKAMAALRSLSGESPIDAFNTGLVGHGTLSEFSKIGRVLDADEIFYIGLYHDDSDEQPEWKSISHRQTTEIRKLLDTPIITEGSIQGIIHAWHSGADPSFFQVREIITKTLVRCEYEEPLHDSVHLATAIPNTVVHVYGRIEWDTVTNAIINIHANDIEAAEPLSGFEFQKLFGAAPEYTGDLSTTDYLDWLRDDE